MYFKAGHMGIQRDELSFKRIISKDSSERV
jgi:hypothetical protein